jgi:hypothetical protein
MSIGAPVYINNFFAGAQAPRLGAGQSGGIMFCMEGFAPIGYDRDNLFDGNEWPWSRLVTNGDAGTEQRVLEVSDWGTRMIWPSGNTTWPYWIQGQVKDENGNPLTSWVSLRIYYSATEILLYELEADGYRDPVVDSVNGTFRLGVPDNTSDFYIVATSAGPERAGSSSRALRGVAA